MSAETALLQKISRQAAALKAAAEGIEISGGGDVVAMRTGVQFDLAYAAGVVSGSGVLPSAITDPAKAHLWFSIRQPVNTSDKDANGFYIPIDDITSGEIFPGEKASNVLLGAFDIQRYMDIVSGSGSLSIKILSADQKTVVVSGDTGIYGYTTPPQLRVDVVEYA